MKKDEILSKLAAGDLDTQEASRLLDELDMANRKRLEDDLARNQAMLQATIDCLPFDFFALDLGGRYILQNAVSKAHWGDALGKTPQQICSDSQNLAIWLENNQRAFNGETVEEDVTMTNQGEKRYYQNRITPIRNRGTLYGILGVNIDITERKRAEDILQEANNELERKVRERTADLQQSHVALRQSEQRLRSYFEQGLMGMAISMGGTNWTEVNDRFCEIMGYSKEEISQRMRTDFIHPDDVESARKDYVRLLTGESDYYTADRRYIRKDGKVIYLMVFVKVFRSWDGTVDNVLGLFNDVTERKHAQDALRQSHDQLQAIYDGMSDGLLVADIQTRSFVHANASMCKMLGYTEAELLTKSVKDIHSTESLPFVIEQFHALAEGKLRVSEDVPVLRKDGSVFYAVVSSSGVDYGDRHCVVGFFRDSTDRKQAEVERRKNEERFRSYFEQGLLGMTISGSDMRWLEVNDRFCNMIGCSREEALQRKITDFVHPEDSKAFHRSYSQLVSGETDHYTAARRYILNNGNVIYLNIYVKAFRSENGTLDHILALHDDITEWRQAEAALRQSHDELRTIYEEMADGIIIVTIENPHPLRANAAICRMLGYSEEEMRTILPAKVHPPEVLPIIQEHLETVKQHGVARIADFPFLRKEGKLVYADVVVSQIVYDGQPCWITFVHDVTERKLLQESIQREHRTLKHLLHSSDHERQTIAYEIHDGLAQYLAAAIMQFDVYKSHREKKPNEATRSYDAAVTMLRQGHSEARRLIAGIRHPVLDEAGVVEAVAHLINERNREAGPKIEFHSHVDFSRLVPLLENAIYRIIQEGMTNACKYGQSERVRITLLQQKDRLRIEIRDWGIGFNTKDIKEGSYGLTGIRERARLLGGKYRLQSKVDKGTRILVELPLMERDG